MPIVGGENSGGTAIVEVANYSALPAANTVGGELYAVLASQGTAWLPGSLGGTYYPKGLYYSDNSSWIYTETPYNANQATLDAGTNDDSFVTPKTFTNASKWGLFQLLSGKDSSGGYVGLTALKINFKNAANTFTSFFTNANTAQRTYTFQDRDGTIADDTDLALKLTKTSNLSDLNNIYNSRQNLLIDKRTGFGDADYTQLINDIEIVTTTTFTAPRNLTLVAGQSAGRTTYFIDEAQAISSTNTLTIKPPTGKKLNGVVNGTEVIQTAGAGRTIFCDGSDNFFIDTGIVRTTKTQTLSNKTLDSTNNVDAAVTDLDFLLVNTFKSLYNY